MHVHIPIPTYIYHLYNACKCASFIRHLSWLHNPHTGICYINQYCHVVITYYHWENRLLSSFNPTVNTIAMLRCWRSIMHSYISKFAIVWIAYNYTSRNVILSIIYTPACEAELRTQFLQNIFKFPCPSWYFFKSKLWGYILPMQIVIIHFILVKLSWLCQMSWHMTAIHLQWESKLLLSITLKQY